MRVLLASFALLFCASAFSLLQVGVKDIKVRKINLPLFVLAQIFLSFAFLGFAVWQITLLDTLQSWTLNAKVRQGQADSSLQRTQSSILPPSIVRQARPTALVALAILTVLTPAWRFSMIAHQKAVEDISRIANIVSLTLSLLTTLVLARTRTISPGVSTLYFSSCRRITISGNVIGCCEWLHQIVE